MIIQHNIPAMNSYRNLNNNQNAIAGNLEKLSSGYQINRAGDNAAGLAISEKMRSQITGLDAAQKNVADGISLVKTAEGALQEVHDMLNRMTELATLSANGTFDDEVDRAALQDEVVQLQEEINRIADSTNFNGMDLLNGALDGTDIVKVLTAGNDSSVNLDGVISKSITTEDVIAGDYLTNTFSSQAIKDIFSGVEDLSTLDFEDMFIGYTDENGEVGYVKVNLSNIQLTTDGDIADDIMDSIINSEAEKYADAVVDKYDALAKADATLHIVDDMDDYRGVVGSTVTGENYVSQADYDAYISGLREAAIADFKNGDTSFTDQIANTLVTEAANGADGTFGTAGALATQTPNGSFTTSMYDGTPTTAMVETNIEADIKAYYDAGGKSGGSYANTNAALSSFGADDVAEAVDDAIADNQAKLLSAINNAFDSAGVDIKATLNSDGELELTGGTDVVPGQIVADKDGSGTVNRGDYAFEFTASTETLTDGIMINLPTNVNDLQAGDTIEVNGNKYVFTDQMPDEDGSNKQVDGTTYISLYNTLSDGTTETGAFIKKDLDTLTSDLADAIAADHLAGSADPDSEWYGIPTAGVTYDQGSGQIFVPSLAPELLVNESDKSLQLQIGDTSDEFNQLHVTVQDMHTDNLGVWDEYGVLQKGQSIADVDVGDQDGAKAAIDVIKAAINQVSTNRAGLGAIQNRLEHTAANLSVMEENITDAESTIRDTDVAAEMMEYTKNNILIQSSQSMLAQANQLPQGVLQLLG